MESTKINLHTINEWEENVKALSFVVEFRECLLDHGMVTKFNGTAYIDGKIRNFSWNGEGKCFYNGRRVKQYDIPFN